MNKESDATKIVLKKYKNIKISFFDKNTLFFG
jgi:hypothetical protein